MTDQGDASVEAALKGLANGYARAMDQGDAAVLARLVTDDIVISGPGFRYDGKEAVLAIPSILRGLYVATRHEIANAMLVGSTPDGAQAESYCTASHLLAAAAEEDEARAIEVWSIRYQDTLRLDDQGWRFSRRELLVDWIEHRTVTLP